MELDQQEAWNTIMDIVAHGETAEVRMTEDGLKIYESKKQLRYGKPRAAKGKERRKR